MRKHEQHTNAPFTKEEEENFFHHWGNCPARPGKQESGCHTSYGNNLVLFMNTTSNLFSVKEQMFELGWKYFTRTGADGEPLFDKNGLQEGYRYNILNRGIYVPTFLSQYFYRHVVRLYLLTLEQYSLETKENAETNQMTFKDFKNWFLRDFNDWLNEHKLNG